MEIKMDNPMKDEHTNEDLPGVDTVMVPKSICPGMEWKPGDEMVLRVKNVMGDKLEMEYAPEHVDSEEESSEMPSDKEAMDMPLDKLEKKLPKAERDSSY